MWVAFNQHPSNSQHGFVCPKKVHQIPLMKLPCVPFIALFADVNYAALLDLNQT